jgi:hypothetical protein
MKLHRFSSNSLPWFLCLLLTACTVTPRIVRLPSASFDGGAQNSGFQGFDSDGSGILTAHARERYNGLIRAYGSRFVVPLVVDEGLSARGTVPETWKIDPEHLVKFERMNRWDKSR